MAGRRLECPLTLIFLIAALGWAPAHAAALDTPDLAGPWGSPTTTELASLWWNPAGLPAGRGHRLFVEAAPTFGEMSLQRSGENAGSDAFGFQGVLPYLALASDLDVPGLGVGVALAVPSARGGASVSESGVGRYHLREGSSTTAHVIFAGGYEVKDKVALGVAFHLVQSTWSADLDNDTMVDLHDEILALEETPSYTDADLEDPRYAAALTFDSLKSRSSTYSIGLRGQPIPRLALGASWTAGYRLEHTGDAAIAFGCPPNTDALGRFGAEKYGICDRTFVADAGVAYDMPSRLHLGVEGEPAEGLVVSAFGGFVAWSVFDDYEISIANIGGRNDFDDDYQAENTPALVEQERLWARDAADSFFAGLDVKGSLLDDRLLLGGRATFDRAAIPDASLSPNNWDADDIALTGLLALRPVKPLRLGLSFTHHILAERVVEESAFGMTLVEAERKEDRYFYPESAGTYTGRINRLGLSLAAGF